MPGGGGGWGVFGKTTSYAICICGHAHKEHTVVGDSSQCNMRMVTRSHCNCEMYRATVEVYGNGAYLFRNGRRGAQYPGALISSVNKFNADLDRAAAGEQLLWLLEPQCDWCSVDAVTPESFGFYCLGPDGEVQTPVKENHDGKRSDTGKFAMLCLDCVEESNARRLYASAVRRSDAE